MKPSPASDWACHSIVCPVDFSAQSRLALHAAAAVADRFDAQLTVLYVEDPLLSQAAKVAFDARALAKAADAELRQFVQRAMRRDYGERAIAYRIVAGQPATEIGKTVRRVAADLVVMGTHGLSGPKKLVVGSTTEAVLRQAHVPVLAVPPGAARLVHGRRWPASRIVAAIELETHAASDVRRATSVASALGASLLLVHVVPPTVVPRWLQRHLQDQDRRHLMKARERLRALHATRTSVNVESRILLGDPAEEIAALAADSNASLVVLVLQRGRGLFGPRKASMTYRVLCGSATPVLAVPASAL